MSKSFPRRQLLTLLLAVGAVGPLAAQEKYPIKWEEQPKLHTIPDSFKKLSAAFILEERQTEVGDEGGSDYFMYRTIHNIIRLVDDKGVEAFNTFKIPIAGTRKLVNVRARTILPGGKVIEVSKDKIKEAKSEDGGPEYLIAMEGVQSGAEVELLYTEQRPMNSFGGEIYQSSIPVLKAVHNLIVPEKLKYDLKGYNGFPTPVDSNADGYRFYKAVQYNIPGLEDEIYSLYRPNLQRLDYKLSYVIGAESEVRRLTWSDLAKQIYKMYCTHTDKEARIASKYIQSIGVSQDQPLETRIRTIEDRLKTDINMSEELQDENAADFDRILSKKLTTEQGFVRFFAACLNAAAVPYELGLVASRFAYPMDEALEQYNHLDAYALYFPDLKTYISPSAVNFRYPFTPVLMGGSKGLFSKTTTLGSMVSALPDIRTIPYTPIEKTTNGINADVTFLPNSLTPAINIVHSFGGYSSTGIREIFLYGSKDKEKEVVMSLIGIAAKASEIQDYKIEDAAFVNYTLNKPVRIVATVQAPELMEKAGPKYLFKVGDIIGRQVEMYHDDHRALPIDIEYAHSLDRNINITIPQGYKIANPESVKLNFVHSEGGKAQMGFTSDYKMEGNIMKITIHEFYDRLNYPVTMYETFRKVINASADFNKVVLVLQKV